MINLTTEKIFLEFHSKIKYFYLENELHKNRVRYIKALKGDFNLAAKSNLIISIGFLGAAIKAAFAFNKPIIFSSKMKIIMMISF